MAAVLTLLIALNVLLQAAVQGAEPMNTKECTKDEDCTMFPHTKCMSDPTDSKTRCMCQDKLCNLTAKKPLHAECKDNEDCIENAECDFLHDNVTEPAPKYCQCKTPEFREFGGMKCVPLGRRCNYTAECKEDVNTTCVEDKVDHQMRCLCGNGNAPKAVDTCVKDSLLRPCESNDYCPINAECSVSSNGRKLCDCKATFKRSSDNIQCEPSSAGRAGIVPVTLILIYVSVTTIF